MIVVVMRLLIFRRWCVMVALTLPLLRARRRRVVIIRLARSDPKIISTIVESLDNAANVERCIGRRSGEQTHDVKPGRKSSM